MIFIICDTSSKLDLEKREGKFMISNKRCVENDYCLKSSSERFATLAYSCVKSNTIALKNVDTDYRRSIPSS